MKHILQFLSRVFQIRQAPNDLFDRERPTGGSVAGTPAASIRGRPRLVAEPGRPVNPAGYGGGRSGGRGSEATRSTVLTFLLSDLVTGACRFAVICADAQYASIASRSGDWIERRFVSPADWRLFASALTLGLEPGPLPADHVVSRMLTDERKRRGTIVQYVASKRLAFEAPLAATRLDKHLRSIASSATF